MDDDQTPVPSEPWISRSVWAFAPALFFYEMLLGLVWFFTLGFIFDPLFVMITMLPATVYFVYLMGIKCASEETAPKVPRGRIFGTSFLVALINTFFVFLLTKDQISTEIARNPDSLKTFMNPIITSGQLSPDELAQIDPASIWALSAALVAFLGVFLLHVISLWVGVRSVEKVRR
jgi:hypothetical protein